MTFLEKQSEQESESLTASEKEDISQVVDKRAPEEIFIEKKDDNLLKKPEVSKPRRAKVGLSGSGAGVGISKFFASIGGKQACLEEDELPLPQYRDHVHDLHSIQSSQRQKQKEKFKRRINHTSTYENLSQYYNKQVTLTSEDDS